MTTNPESPGAAIVTGGGRGVGRAIALRLARKQPVVVVGRTVADLNDVCAEIRAAGGTAATCVGDVADPATAVAAPETVRGRGWRLTHLVCNAGIGKSGPTADFDPQLWRQIFEVNVHGCFQLVRACLPLLLESPRSAISIMSSISGTQGVSHDCAYAATKHALVGMARSWSLEFAKRGLTVAALCPSFIESDMTRRTIQGLMRRRGLSEEAARRRIAGACPAGRILSAEEVAEAVALVGVGNVQEAKTLAATGGYSIFCEPPRPAVQDKEEAHG